MADPSDMEVLPVDKFGDIGVLPSLEDVQARIDSAYDDTYYVDKKGIRRPYVCSVCDEFLLSLSELRWYPIKKLLTDKRQYLEWSKVVEAEHRIQPIMDNFTFNDVNGHVKESDGDLEGVALSPRGIIGRKSSHRNSKWGFSICSYCEGALDKKYTPLYAIVNMNHIGCAPVCLKELTEVELLMVTPVKCHGYVVTYTGGEAKNLKGSFTFMRADPRKQGRSIAHLEGMGLLNHVILLLQGKMTARQIARAKQKYHIRTEKVLEAVQWLNENNSIWKGVDMARYRRELANSTPIVVDRSEEVEGSNNNVEDKELFSCFFPDGTSDENKGGFDTKEAWMDYVETMQREKFELKMKQNLEREFLSAQDGDLFINACLLQFPYGHGGTEEQRVMKNGTLSSSVDWKESFLSHLSKLSDPIFQESMFQLILYSQWSKFRLLRKSSMTTRSEDTVKNLVHKLKSADVTEAVKARRQRRPDYTVGSDAAKALLNAVEATSQALPHTKEAARVARSNANAMQHHFGIGSIFLTVTFDDETSSLILILSGNEDKLNFNADQLNDDEVKKFHKERCELRIRVPGICSINFELLLDILFRDVIGWDRKNNCANDTLGLFGKCYGLTMSVEEQGRKTLHTHMMLWIEGFRDLQQKSFFGSEEERILAQTTLLSYYSRFIETKMFSTCTRILRKAFDHECVVPKHERRALEVVPDQELRYLRHRMGYEHTGGKFATCPECQKIFTYEQLMNLYCVRHLKMHQATDLQETEDPSMWKPKERMEAHIMQFQSVRGADGIPDRIVETIHARYQHHTSQHPCVCFHCQKGKNRKTHVCGPNCECRYRLPDRKRREALIYEVSRTQKWFKWNGEPKDQPIIEFLPRRRKLDLFQNVCCKAVSESKFSCNSNMAIITDGPVGQYQFKYHIKDTQEEEQKAYGAVDESIKNLMDRVHDDDVAEAKRRMARAAFAHNKQNVIGPSMAGYLTRNEDRFYFSHSFVYCPLRDLVKILKGGKVKGRVKYTKGGRMYFENYALDYLCRHKDLERVGPKEYFENYEKTQLSNKRKRDEGELSEFPFQNDTGYFQHPNAEKNKAGTTWLKASWGSAESTQMLRVKVPQYIFPDTAKFKGHLLTSNQDDICSVMEKYAEFMLVLLLPYRCFEDFDPRTPFRFGKFPFVAKLREVHVAEQLSGELYIFSEKNLQFLQNIQDCAYNSMRYKPGKDDLQRNTNPLVTESMPKDDSYDQDEDEEEVDIDANPYEDLLDQLDGHDVTDSDPQFLKEKLSAFGFKEIRNKGKMRCGYDNLTPAPPKATLNEQQNFVNFESTNNATGSSEPARHKERNKYSVRKVVEIMFERSQKKARAAIFKNNPGVEVSDANGSPASIREWGKAAGLDPIQRRAFESITAAFLITFFDIDPKVEAADESTARQKNTHRKLKVALLRLKGRIRRRDGVINEKDLQLICLVHGPGGSGKSTVINLVTAYAKEFCGKIGHQFTSRTIIVTAMTGVAATLLHGETTHKATGLNKTRLKDEDISEWGEDARLLIIDEISFASPGDFAKLSKNLQVLMKCDFLEYGGLNIVFAGDYSQLEPPGRPTVYNCGHTTPEFHNTIDTFIELNGQHRFNKDPPWGEMCYRFRQGTPTLEDIQTLNEKCLISETNKPQPGIQVATYQNADRDAINSRVFETYCQAYGPEDGSILEGVILVFMDKLKMRNGRKLYETIKSNHVQKHFYEHCGENDCISGGGSAKGGKEYKKRVDPVLKLYPNCPMMMTDNLDVLCGKANGSRVNVKAVNTKDDEEPFTVKLPCGTLVRAFFCSQLKSLTVEHEMEDMTPRQFEVEPSEWAFQSTMLVQGLKQEFLMKGMQFRLVSNSATTGHKLQGYTAKSLLVNDWQYQANWAYVVLSRVTTMAGLYFRQKLSEDLDKYKKDKRMLKMLDKFRETVAIVNPTEQEYHDMEKLTESII